MIAFNKKRTAIIFVFIFLFLIFSIILLNGCFNSSNDSANDNFTDNPSTESNMGFLKGVGPILIDGDFQSSFKLYQYDISNGNKKEIFNFTNNSKKFTTSVKLSKDLIYRSHFYKQLFSHDLDKFAVNWYEDDKSYHVGWVDKNGSITDVTTKLHPAQSGFSSSTPKDSNALFTPDGHFFFYDGVAQKYCFMDISSYSITREIPKSQKDLEISFNSENILFSPDGNMVGVSGTDCSRMHIDGKIMCPSSRSYGVAPEDISEDCVIYGVGLNNKEGNYTYIGKFSGKDITQENTGHTFCYPWVPSQKDGASMIDKNMQYIQSSQLSPKTDYTIVNCCYCNHKIAFTAYKGNENSIFVMDDNQLNEPKKVVEYDSKYQLLFWI